MLNQQLKAFNSLGSLQWIIWELLIFKRFDQLGNPQSLSSSQSITFLVFFLQAFVFFLISSKKKKARNWYIFLLNPPPSHLQSFSNRIFLGRNAVMRLGLGSTPENEHLAGIGILGKVTNPPQHSCRFYGYLSHSRLKFWGWLSSYLKVIPDYYSQMKNLKSSWNGSKTLQEMIMRVKAMWPLKLSNFQQVNQKRKRKITEQNPINVFLSGGAGGRLIGFLFGFYFKDRWWSRRSTMIHP